MGGEGGGGQGGGGQGGGPGQGGGGQGQGASGEGGSTSSAGDDGVWGLATGGGGCACTTTGARDDRSTLGLLCAALGLAAASRRRSKKGQRGEGVSR
jgi:MYXO-CTERM domain-containing protein